MALPSGTTGSLRPTFVPARPIGLAVKHPYTFTLDARLPTGLRVPLHSSVLRVTPVRFRASTCVLVVTGGRAFLPASRRRRRARTVSSSRSSSREEGRGVRRAVSEDSQIALATWAFPADCPHPARCDWSQSDRVARDSRMFQHIAECFTRRHRRAGQH
jgi:hypothetical protein